MLDVLSRPARLPATLLTFLLLLVTASGVRLVHAAAPPAAPTLPAFLRPPHGGSPASPAAAPQTRRLAPARFDRRDPATWSAWTLAAQLTISCVDVHHLGRARYQATRGMGGVTLLGSRPPADLAALLGGVRRAAAHGLTPIVMSDEEGGTVQRLRSLLGRLPSAQTMGGWSRARVRRTAHDYAVRMRRHGVRMDLAPVADLTVPGAYMTRLHRTFSADPDRVAALDRAWRLGMADAGVATVVKHWPGHGHAPNSHTGPARVPPLRVLERADMLPFDRELARGAPAVMVGHLTSSGLTASRVPASESAHALHYLRDKAGPNAVIMTDSLAMAAASSSRGITPAQAAVQALRAGADWAMACDSHPVATVDAIRDAIRAGTLPRARAEASARRILALKSRYGVLPR